METVINFLTQYWYLGLVIVIIIWEIIRLILRRIFKRFFGFVFAPLKVVGIKLFGNAKILNLELFSLLLFAIAFIMYLTLAG